MNNKDSPCAADALFGTKTITVNGKTAGIARLCDAIGAVRALKLDRDDALRAALPVRVGQENHIPEKFRGDYAGALPREYRRTVEKTTGAGRS